MGTRKRRFIVAAMLVVVICSSILNRSATAWTSLGCTWPHTPGQWTFVYYMWGDAIDADPYTSWRTVFSDGRDAWNGAQGRIRIIEVSNTPGQYTSYWLADDSDGTTWITCSGGNLTSYVSGGNRYWSPYDPTELGMLGDHEIGHSLGLGEGNNPNSVMWSPWFYGQAQYPQPDDLTGIDTLYP